MIRYLLNCVVAATILVHAAFGQAVPERPLLTKPLSWRAHYLIHVDANLRDDYHVTVAISVSDELITHKVLVLDPEGQRFVLESDADMVAHTYSNQVTDLRSGEFILETDIQPYTAKGWKATSDERQSRPELMNDKYGRFEISFKGNRGEITGTLDGWQDPQIAQRWRKAIRAMLLPQFIESLEQMDTSGIFRSPEMLNLDDLLMPKILYRTDCHPGAEPQLLAQAPACEFDSKFGLDCSDERKEKATAVAKKMEGQPPGSVNPAY